MLTKAQHRQRMRELLRAVTPEQLAAGSDAVRARLLGLPQVQTADSVFCYVSAPSEIDTHALLTQLLARGKTVAVPLIVGPHQMQAHRIDNLGDCVPGAFGLLAPRIPRPFTGDPEVCIAPGLAFTTAGSRLGKAGGYYDAFLAAHPATLVIAVGLDVQIVDELPMTATDRLVHLIVTPTRLIRCTRERTE